MGYLEEGLALIFIGFFLFDVHLEFNSDFATP